MVGSADDPIYFDFAVLCLRLYLSLILVTCVQKVCAILFIVTRDIKTLCY